jgi:hypothetical protein
MAYIAKDLQVVGAQVGTSPTMWSYRTADTVATVNTAEYFNGAVQILEAGDLIYILSSADGTAVATLNYVLTNDGTDVDVNDGTVLANTDGD